jgi:ABC-type dipeptide/oligopeptide/nickel transport system permease component
VGVVLLFFAPYIVVAEDQSAISAIKKSISLVKANIVNIILIGVVLLVVGFVIGFVLGLLMGLLSNALAGMPGQIAAGFLSSLVNAFLGVVTTGAFMAYYLSLGSGGNSEASA